MLSTMPSAAVFSTTSGARISSTSKRLARSANEIFAPPGEVRARESSRCRNRSGCDRTPPVVHPGVPRVGRAAAGPVGACAEEDRQQSLAEHPDGFAIGRFGVLCPVGQGFDDPPTFGRGSCLPGPAEHLSSRRLAVPLYGYQCKDCREVFEVRATIKEKEVGLVLACPKCGSPEARQMLTFASMLHGGKLTPQPTCGPSAGSGCCG